MNTAGAKLAYSSSGIVSSAGVFPELMTEEELIVFLRIPEISTAGDYGNAIDNLRRMHDLPCIHICNQPLYPLSAVRKWLDAKLEKEQRR